MSLHILEPMPRIFLIITSLFLCVSSFAGPAREGLFFLEQPDGSSFKARFLGDEWTKIQLTEDGCAIKQGNDKWWYIAYYDQDGRKRTTEYKVGDEVPADVLSKSRQVPYELLAQKAMEYRRPALLAQARERTLMSRLNNESEDSQVKVKYGLVILAEFNGTNEKFTYKKEDFEKLLNQSGYSVNGGTGSAKDYFEDQFGENYEFRFDVTDIVTLPKLMSYYGANDDDTGNDLRAHEMVADACKLLDDDVDFSRYDQDGDGQVDNVFLFFAGNDEAEGFSSDHIWSHAWYIASGGINLTLDGVKINRYACSAELRRIGTKDYMAAIGSFCHEYSHTFGLPDLYDTNYQIGGFAAATWRSLSLMDAGNFNNNGNTPPNLNVVEREYLGISDIREIDKEGAYQMESISKGLGYKINTGTEGEFFLMECRTNEGWDSAIGGEGMLIYHIDRSIMDSGESYLLGNSITAIDRWTMTNEVNALADHQCADLIEADGRGDKFNTHTDAEYINWLRDISGVFYPYGSRNSVTAITVPGLECWGDSEAQFGVADITYDDGIITFKAVAYKEFESVKVDPFQNDAILTFQMLAAGSDNAKIEYGPTDGQKTSVNVRAYEKGKWAVVLGGLMPNTSYRAKVTVYDSDGGVLSDMSTSFLTKKKNDTQPPYIYLGGIERTSSGNFKKGTKLPLRVFNAQDAKDVRWEFDGVEITPSSDCYYTVEKSGELRAFVVWDQGAEVITKYIRLEND